MSQSMLFRRWSQAAAVAALIGLSVSAVQAREIVVASGPPPIHEVTPAARAGYVWIPGSYTWRTNPGVYRWHKGYWVKARPGWNYRASTWDQRSNGWVYRPGGWER